MIQAQLFYLKIILYENIWKIYFVCFLDDLDLLTYTTVGSRVAIVLLFLSKGPNDTFIPFKKGILKIILKVFWKVFESSVKFCSFDQIPFTKNTFQWLHWLGHGIEGYNNIWLNYSCVKFKEFLRTTCIPGCIFNSSTRFWMWTQI